MTTQPTTRIHPDEAIGQSPRCYHEAITTIRVRFADPDRGGGTVTTDRCVRCRAERDTTVTDVTAIGPWRFADQL